MYNKLKKLLLATIFCFYCINNYAEQIAMGSWRTHISYLNIQQIEQSENKIYGVSSGALFSIYKDDYTIESYSKIYGLNDNNIRLIKYSDTNNLLFIAYENSNIDLMSEEGEIINITDIYRKSINGSKKINDVFFKDNHAYIACDFGITTLNLNKFEFSDTYMIGDNGGAVQVLNINIHNDTIYALTPENILYAPIKNTNLLNFQNWKKFSNPNINKKNAQMSILNDTIYLLKSDKILYKFNNNIWKQNATNITSVFFDNGTFCIIDNTKKLTMTNYSNVNFVTGNTLDASYDPKNNIIWIATSNGVLSHNNATKENNTFKPDGPYSNTSWRLKYADGRIYSIPGGRFASNYYTDASLSIFENEKWTNYTTDYFKSYTTTISRCYDLVDIAIDPNDKSHFWIASYGIGLYEFRNDEIVNFHYYGNSGLTTEVPNDPYNYTRTDGMTYDEYGNLWILNNGNGALIKYIDPNGTYHEVKHDVYAGTPQDIIISNKNSKQKFVFIPRYKSTTTSLLFSFDDNGTLSNISDDKKVSFTKVYDQDNKEINFEVTAQLRSIVQDKNGVLWIGMTQGLFLINNPEKVFNSDFRCYRIKIPRNDGSGLADYLLGTEEITALAVDGANRKWIGTAASGVYLVSEDGQETIHHFTAENSPLLSDAIQSIAINEQTGEVFFGTGNGLISYQSDATEGGNKFNNVHAYPNPVRPEYSGPITITGLTADTQIRITDINGNLVYETISNGGIATWNGCRTSGDKVSTGVYFAHCISADGKYKHIVKILIIK